ncbi:hypothetical protein F3K31_26080 (plasmid) [Escherichia coli]|nr:hypothetical protein [Shigella flexneri]MFD77369.1 hypothetical protein [Escherichia coli]EFY1286073.1 hypothetical protein [Shigella flexneri]OVY43985.1 hypothetical protein B4P02_24530 [Escherichia coli]QOY17276.1 hypothetical protein F3K31_26080 [Escherichia coli]
MVSCGFGLAGGASAVPENIEDSTRWRGASADNPQSHIKVQSAALHAACAACYRDSYFSGNLSLSRFIMKGSQTSGISLLASRITSSI